VAKGAVLQKPFYSTGSNPVAALPKKIKGLKPKHGFSRPFHFFWVHIGVHFWVHQIPAQSLGTSKSPFPSSIRCLNRPFFPFGHPTFLIMSVFICFLNVRVFPGFLLYEVCCKKKFWIVQFSHNCVLGAGVSASSKKANGGLFYQRWSKFFPNRLSFGGPGIMPAPAPRPGG